MRRSIAVVALVLAPLVVFAQSGSPARDPLPPLEQQPTGTGRITVAVVADDNGAPIKRVRVALNGVIVPQQPPGDRYAQRIQREAETDEAGRAEFAGLPAAFYSVGAQMPPSGYVRQSLSKGQQLKDGEAASITIRLLRAGAIMGRILDDTGEPLSRVYVRAIRKDPAYGMPRLATVGSMASSDDRGQFRIYDLPPGDYYVSAWVMGQQYSAGARGAAQTEPKLGYLPTFHPGVASMDAAQTVNVRSGQDTSGVDFSLLRGRLGRVTGIAVDSSGTPISPRSGGVTLHPKSRDGATAMSRSAMLNDDGTFTINDVPPGDYYVTAFARDRTESSPGPPSAEREAVSIPVTVNGDEVVVNPRTNSGATLSGRVVREGPLTPPPAIPGELPAAPASPQAMRVQVSAQPPAMMAGPTFAPGRAEYIDADQTFRITGARGTLMLSAWSSVGALKAIRRDGSDLLGTFFELKGTERIDGIEIVLTTETGSLSGSVTGPDGRPATSAWVVIFPENPTLWYRPFVSISRTISLPPSSLSSRPPQVAPQAALAVPGLRAARSPGEFVSGRLVPGRYYVATLDATDNPSVPFPDPEFLASLKPKATAVTVVAGETARVGIRQ